MIHVVKATGEKESFSEEKLRTSVRRAGIREELQEQVVAHVKGKLYDSISTNEIYNHILEFLQEKEPYARSRFNLKHAIMSLGPSGYPFEDFVAKLLAVQGFNTSVRNHLEGKCITHEVDIIAQKGGFRIMIEAKYHNTPGTKTDVRVAMYTKARFDDLIEKNNLNQVWLVTNTKTTTDAIAYAACMGMKVISWNYPEGESLRELVERSGLVPIASLTSLSQSQQQSLLTQGVIFCKDVCSQPSCLQGLGINEKKQQNVLAECSYLARS